MQYEEKKNPSKCTNQATYYHGMLKQTVNGHRMIKENGSFIMSYDYECFQNIQYL